MGCKNSAGQAKLDPEPSNRGAQPTSAIQTTKSAPSAPPKSQITLHYFDLYGRGELIRMLFTYLKVPYTDHRIEFSEWPALKTTPLCEFEQLPVLEIDGKRMVQTRSIVRFVCQTNKLYPLPINFKDIYMVESVCDLIDDLRAPLMQLAFKKDVEGITEYYNTKISPLLPALEARLSKNTIASGFFVGGSPSMADFTVFEFLWDYFLRPEKRQEHESRLSQFPKIVQFAAKMKTVNPEFKNYLDARVVKWL